VFHTDVAKVDRDVAYAAMVVYCCKRLSSMFHLFLRRMLQACLSGCCIRFTYMLQVFLMLRMFAMVFNYFCKCFRCIFWMFHVPFLYVATVASGYLKSRLSVAHGMHVGSEMGREWAAWALCGRGWCTRGRATSRRRGPTCGCAIRRGNRLQPRVSVRTSWG
jgi:hypothetical protein